MSNILESLGSLLQNKLDNEERAPLHVGEVMNCWMFLAAIHEANIFTQIALNTTSDDELQEMLRDSAKSCEKQTKSMKNFLVNEGIPLPPLTEHKPKSETVGIPSGVKMTDDEIANGVSLKEVTAILLCTNGMTQAVRDDVGKMFLQFLLEKVNFNTSLKNMMRKRGWIKVPPYFTPPAMPKK
ncbi:DUF3231 family protein [Paenisporosarcina sp. TG20]|uniref:DUF3231 family protein n=1 Tax=Paenisporosarcina sp. TG20 TaxID=1211706 RepID=UPI0002EAC5A2|nr:DUF3231 family protein [Paenisporosarcina sp. TG20]